MGKMPTDLEAEEVPQVAEEGSRAHMEALLRNPPDVPRSCDAETTLWLRGCKLNDECAEVLAHALRRGDYKHLTKLVLAANAISARGVCAIAGAISQGALPELTSLSLESCPILDEGMVALCSVLGQMPKMAQMELVQCEIGDLGATALATASRGGHTRCLSSLYMRGNKIADDGMKALMAAFGEPLTNPAAAEGAGFPRMEMMHLNDNAIGDEGCLALSEAIEAGHIDHVRLWQMGGNREMTRDGFEVVTDVLKEYEKQRVINVYF